MSSTSVTSSLDQLDADSFVGYYLISHNASSFTADNKNSYEFWFLGNMIRLIGDKPFSRGDVIQIESVNVKSQEIKVKFIASPTLRDSLPDDCCPIHELPTLVFLTTRVYLDEHSDYHIICDSNSELLLSYSATQDSNKIYALAALVTGDSVRISGAERTTRTEFEWIIDKRNSESE